MAQKRMIDKKISVSEDVANLPVEAQLLFTWMIPHADDAGLLPFSGRAIKALVIPMLDIRASDVEEFLKIMEKLNLITKFEWEGDKFWSINSFSTHQTLKKDRQPQTLLKIRLSEHPIDSWKTLYSIGIPFGNRLEPEVSKEVSKEVRGTEKILKRLRKKFGKRKVGSMEKLGDIINK